MSNALERKVEVGQCVYVVDYRHRSKGGQAYIVKAEVIRVDEKGKSFFAVLDGEIYHTYKFNDYKRLVFDTEEEAERALEKLPNPQTITYHVRGRWIYNKTILGICGQQNTDETYDLEVTPREWI